MGKRRSIMVSIVSEAFVQRMAYILGDCSAASKALAEWERHKAAGDDVALMLTADSTILVGPTPALSAEGEER